MYQIQDAPNQYHHKSNENQLCIASCIQEGPHHKNRNSNCCSSFSVNVTYPPSKSATTHSYLLHINIGTIGIDTHTCVCQIGSLIDQCIHGLDVMRSVDNIPVRVHARSSLGELLDPLANLCDVDIYELLYMSIEQVGIIYQHIKEQMIRYIWHKFTFGRLDRVGDLVGDRLAGVHDCFSCLLHCVLRDVVVYCCSIIQYA